MLKSPFQSPTASAQLLQRFCACVCVYYQTKKNAKSRLNTRKYNWKGFIEFFLDDL